MQGTDSVTVVYSMSLTESCVSQEVAMIVFEVNYCLRALNIEAVWFSETPISTVSQVRRSQWENTSTALLVSHAPGTSRPVSTWPVLRLVTASRHWGLLWILLAGRRRHCECERNVTCRFHGLALSAFFNLSSHNHQDNYVHANLCHTVHGRTSTFGCAMDT